MQGTDLSANLIPKSLQALIGDDGRFPIVAHKRYPSPPSLTGDDEFHGTGPWSGPDRLGRGRRVPRSWALGAASSTELGPRGGEFHGTGPWSGPDGLGRGRRVPRSWALGAASSTELGPRGGEFHGAGPSGRRVPRNWGPETTSSTGTGPWGDEFHRNLSLTTPSWARRRRVPSERGPDRALTGSGDDEFHRNFALIELAGPRAQLPYAPPRPLPNPAAPCRILLHVCNWKTAFIAGRGRNVGSKIDLWTNPCRPKRPFRSRGVARSTRFAREGSLAAPFSLEGGRSKRPFRSRGAARSTTFAREEPLEAPVSLERGLSKHPFRSRGVARNTLFAREGSLETPFSLESGRSKHPFLF